MYVHTHHGKTLHSSCTAINIIDNTLGLDHVDCTARTRQHDELYPKDKSGLASALKQLPGIYLQITKWESMVCPRGVNGLAGVFCGRAWNGAPTATADAVAASAMIWARQWAETNYKYDLCQWKREVKIFFSKILLSKNSRKYPRTVAVGKKRKQILDFSSFSNGCRRRSLFFLVANCQHADKNQLVRRSTLDLKIDSVHGQPARCPARPTDIDDGLEDIRWIHALGGESLPAASYGILSNLKKTIFSIFETDGEFSSSVLCTPAANCFFYHTPGQLPPHDTGIV